MTFAEKRNQFLMQVAQIDSQIMKLNVQITEAFQKAVDLDLKSTGVISDITKEFVETFHYSIDEKGRVTSEKTEYYYRHSADQQTALQESEQNEPERLPAVNKKRNVTQEQLDSLIAEHREKQTAGIYEMLDLSNCIFDDIKFTGRFDEVCFMGSEMNRCTFKNAEIENSIVSNTDFMNSEFDGCSFHNSALSGANMGFCEIADTIFADCTFRQGSFVASNLHDSELSKCDMTSAIAADTKFANVIANKCEGTEHIQYSSIRKSLDTCFDETFINPKMVFDFKIKNPDMVSINIHMADGTINENTIRVHYDMDTHKIKSMEESPDQSKLLRQGIRMMKPDIQKEFQRMQFESRHAHYPCVMVHSSESVNFQEGRLYDLKEFSERLASYGVNNVLTSKSYEKVKYTVLFEDSEGHAHTWGDRYDLHDEAESLIERMHSSGFFSISEIKYLADYILKGGEQPTNEIPMINKSKERKAPYMAYVYTEGKETQKPVCVSGTSPEKIIALCQKRNAGRPHDGQMGVAYMQKYNPQTNVYEHAGKYDIKTGHDVTPIYLKLPPMGKEHFSQTVSILKKNGAKFNRKQKAWYITKQDDMNLFKDYLPAQSEDRTDTKKQQIKKQSVSGSIDKNKDILANMPHQEKQNEQHKSDRLTL